MKLHKSKKSLVDAVRKYPANQIYILATIDGLHYHPPNKSWVLALARSGEYYGVSDEIGLEIYRKEYWDEYNFE